MRHRKKGQKLNRDFKERKALFRQQLISLILRERIKTTAVKAKIVSRIAERIVTLSLDGSNACLNEINSIVNNKEAVKKLISTIVPIFQDRKSGFTRIIKTDRRRGDNSLQVILSWTDEINKIDKKKTDMNLDKSADRNKKIKLKKV